MRFVLIVCTSIILTAIIPAPGPSADVPARTVRLKDLASVEGVRDNPLVGYGMVVGLNGTGDRRQTIFSTQTLGNILRRMGVQIPTGSVRVNNVAAVFVTATLPPFARPGTRVDVTVSSLGDAKSLEGGLLLLTSLNGADGQAYATAQGPVTLGGYTAGGRGNTVQVNHPTAGRIVSGGIVERDTAVDLAKLPKLSLLLREDDFAAASEVAAVINRDAGKNVATAIDGRRVEVNAAAGQSVTGLLARLGDLSVSVHPRAKVVINERTGTVVMGKDVSLGPCSILHGALAIEISTEVQVSQPQPFSQGQTAVVPQTTVRAQESPARRIELREGATVEDLIAGLQSIGATVRDIVAILEAIKAVGALQAEIEVI